MDLRTVLAAHSGSLAVAPGNSTLVHEHRLPLATLLVLEAALRDRRQQETSLTSADGTVHFRTARGRRSLQDEGVHAKGEGVLGVYVGGLGSGELQAAAGAACSLQLLPPGDVCSDKAIASLETCFPGCQDVIEFGMAVRGRGWSFSMGTRDFSKP